MNSGNLHARHLFPIYVGKNFRDAVLVELGKAKIGATVNYRSVPSMSYYVNKYGLDLNAYPVSNLWGEGTLSIPLFPGMKNEEQEYVIDILINKVDQMIRGNL